LEFRSGSLMSNDQGLQVKRLTTAGIKAAAIIVIVVIAALGGGYYWYNATRTPVVAEVKIGLVFPLTGPSATSGELHVRGSQLRADEVNAAGGIKSLGGAKVVLVKADNQGDPKISASETERLIVMEKVVAFVGSYTTATTIPSTEVSERYKIPYVATTGAPQLTTRGFKYVFRAHSEVVKTADISISFLKDVVKVETVALIMENSGYGVASSKVSEAKAKQAGMKVVLSELFPPGSTDLSSIILKVKNANPDAILWVGYISDSLLLMRQMRELNVNVKAIIAPGGAGFNDNEFIRQGKNDAEYCYVGIYWSPDAKWPGNEAFVKHYKEAYGTDADPLAEEAYEAMSVLLNAIERAGSTDPTKIRDSLSKTDMIWVAGPIKFDETGENIYKNVVVVQIQQGKIVTVWPQQAAVAKPILPMPIWDAR